MDEFNLKNYMVVWDIMTNFKNLPVKVWAKAKIDAEKMFKLFENRKNKDISEWDFFRKILESGLDLPLKTLKKADSKNDYFISVHLAIKEDESDNNL